jgi:hypothetical protein
MADIWNKYANTEARTHETRTRCAASVTIDAGHIAVPRAADSSSRISMSRLSLLRILPRPRPKRSA